MPMSSAASSVNKAMQAEVEIQYAQPDGYAVPAPEQFRHWLLAVLQHPQLQVEDSGLPYLLSVRVVDEQESAQLNQEYRGKRGATNVLSFPFEWPVGVPQQDAILLGDLVICAAVVEREAGAQGKSVDSHWAHMLVHGVLHLLGYDHQDDEQAEIMERFEIRILEHLGFADPYADTD